jgi:hypothetical protein
MNPSRRHPRGDRPPRRRPRGHWPLPRAAIAHMLEQQLEYLSSELPASLTTAIQTADIDFAAATIAKQSNLHGRPELARKVAAGIAWERALIDHVTHITRQSSDLRITGVRWQPQGARFDLDLVVADHHKGVCWVLDAKLAKPAPGQIRNMPRQITAATKTPAVNDGCPSSIGLIIHHRNHLYTQLTTTDDLRVYRCTMQAVGNLLLAKRATLTAGMSPSWALKQ